MTEPTTMHVLPGRLRVEIDSSVPAHRLRPALVGSRGRSIWLAHSRPRVVSAPHAARQQVEFDCDLAAHAGPARRLQLWVDGFLLQEQILSTSSVACSIADIINYAVTGWITHGAADTAILHLNGAPIQAIARVPPDAATPEGCLRFAAALPASALNGRRHLIEIVAGGVVLASRRWRSHLRINLTMSRDAVTLRLVDPALAGGHVSLSAVDTATDERVFQGAIDASGGELRIVVPAKAGLVILRAGGTAQLELGRLLPLSQAHRVAHARSVVRQILLADPGNAVTRAPDRTMLNHQRHDDAPTHRLHPGGVGHGVTVIVPVCKGVLQTRSCLASLQAALGDGDAIEEIILVDDATDDPAMAIVLAAHAAPDAAVPCIVLRQNQRRGFVAAITRGIAAAQPSHDIILLNADTIVPPRFAARLRAAAHARPDIASATPLSNNATILSLPDAQAANDLTAAEVMSLDAKLEATPAAGVDIPTGIGFCLYIRRDALDDVGPLDPVWGHGYCEEVDWCLRARDRGWSHVAAVDIAVFHQGSVSFGASERDAMLARNHPLLEARYPEYTGELRHFLARDTLADLRADAFCRLLAARVTQCLLHFTHAMGGGTAILVDALAARFADAPGRANIACSRLRDEFRNADIFLIKWTERGLSLRLPHDAIGAFVARLGTAGITLRMLLHSLTGVGPAIRAIAATGIPYSVYVHDYQWYCPRVVLVDQTGHHCNEPGQRYCQLCVRANPIYDFGIEDAAIRADLSAWVGANAGLLASAVAVIAPSQDSFARLRRQFPHARLRVVPHPDRTEDARIGRAGDAQEITRIAVVGGLSVQKGRDVLFRLSAAIEAAHAPIRIEVFGAVEHAEAFSAFACVRLHGPYARADLADLLTEAHPHFVLFPAVWPETWCFALSDVWASGYPAVAFDIGAIAERIRSTGAGALLAFAPDADLIAPVIAARATVAALHGHRFQIAPITTDDPIAELFAT